MELLKIGTEKSWLQISLLMIIIMISATLVNCSSNTAEVALTWSINAAKDAERVATVNCSGHGHAFIDGKVTDATLQCRCNNCYEGQDCSQMRPGCSADAAVGDAMFLEDYWLKYKESSAVLISGWSRMSYFTNQPGYISYELEKCIRDLHKAFGNAVVDDKYIIFGNGVTQLLNLFVRALAQPKLESSTTAKVVARVPYYPVFRRQTELLNAKHYEWMGNASSYVNTTTPEDFIEFVTSPNNPDGHLTKAVINGSLTIHDNVYYWPHYVPITGPIDEDIMMFTLSKFTGHAGSRFGWALVRNEKLYRLVSEFMDMSSEGTSQDAQQRAFVLLKDTVQKIKEPDRSNDISYYGFDVMQSRWEKLESVILKSDRFSLQSRPIRFCNYMKRYRRFTPGFAWLRCNYENEPNCRKVLTNGRIVSSAGERFGADPRFARLSLIKTRDDFNQLMNKLTKLVSKNETSASV